MAFPLDKYLFELRNQGFSQKYVTEISEYAINLAGNGLPVIFSTKHFSELLEIDYQYLLNIISDSTRHYSGYKVRKKSGGTRWILAPKMHLKDIQKWIENNILNIVPVHDRAHGFVKGKSILSNAEMHQKKDMILNVDLYKFFDSLTIKRVYGIFTKMGYIKNLAWDLAHLLCTAPPLEYVGEINSEGIFNLDLNAQILPQGSPASPAITNYICNSLDKRFAGLSAKLNCSYSRYADDITFSGERDSIPSINTVKKIILEEGFFINEKKIKFNYKGKRQLVTGLVVNDGISVKKEIKNEVKQHLYYCKKYGVSAHLQYLKEKQGFEKSNYKDWLLGKIFFIHSIQPHLSARFLDQFQTIEWEI